MRLCAIDKFLYLVFCCKKSLTFPEVNNNIEKITFFLRLLIVNLKFILYLNHWKTSIMKLCVIDKLSFLVFCFKKTLSFPKINNNIESIIISFKTFNCKFEFSIGQLYFIVYIYLVKILLEISNTKLNIFYTFNDLQKISKQIIRVI